MTYEDFYISCKPNFHRITECLSKAFGIDEEQIEVSQNPKEFSFQKQLRCEVSLFKGEFPYRLEMVSLEHDVLEIDILEKIGLFCELLECVSFYFGPAENSNPFMGLLIYKRKSYQQVLLNQDHLSHYKEIIVSKLGKIFSDPDDWDDSDFLKEML